MSSSVRSAYKLATTSPAKLTQHSCVLLWVGYGEAACEAALSKSGGDVRAAARLLVESEPEPAPSEAAAAPTEAETAAANAEARAEAKARAKARAAELEGEWVEARSSEGGLYYWNTATRRVVWEADAPAIITRQAVRERLSLFMF